MYTFPDGTLRPCAARYGRVHGPFTAVYTAVYDGCYTAVRHMHTSTPQLKGRVRAMYTSVYTGQIGTLRPWAMYTALTRHVHGRVPAVYTAQTTLVHGRLTAEYKAVNGRVRAM